MTQFGRALAELNIDILCADTPQAKGRVERVNRTLQDRLVKELRLAGIAGVDEANAFLPGFVERFNARFAVAPARPGDLHRPLNLSAGRLDDILAFVPVDLDHPSPAYGPSRRPARGAEIAERDR